MPTNDNISNNSNDTNIGNIQNSGNTNVPLKNESQQHVVLPSFSKITRGSSQIGSRPASAISGQPNPVNVPAEGNAPYMVNLSVASFDNPLPPPVQSQQTSSHNISQVQQPQVQPLQVQQPQIQQSVQQPVQQPVQQMMQQSEDYRPLNVKDALTYLEQVKLQFTSSPDIYNHFLDVMKDFKSQSIDTPGVIERVSTLFRGYPNLIQGFNTFLPQGYTIECTANPDDPIMVTTPLGSQMMTATVNNATGSVFKMNGTMALTSATNDSKDSAVASVTSAPNANDSTLTTTDQQKTQPATNGVDSAAQTNAQPDKPADVEFSQAVSYVNKIKNRFADQPDVYKHFLEILQTYQREQKPINEVYAQVTVLFQNAPDLLDDFKRFLPDAAPSAEASQHPMVIQPGLNYTAMSQQSQQQVPYSANSYYQQVGIPNQNQNLPPIGNFPPAVNGGAAQVHQEEYHPDNQQVIGLAGTVQQPPEQRLRQFPHETTNEIIQVSDLRSSAIDKTINNYSPLELAQLQQQQLQLQQQQQQRSQIDNRYAAEANVRPEIDLDPSIVPVIPRPTEPIEDSLSLIEETNFFDKVKKYIGNKQIYMEFLKVLNLYSQDILDLNQLVDKVDNYIGSSNELFTWFKNFVGFQDKPKTIENIVHEKHKLDLDLCEACGPSYKKLPKTDTFMPCSGRDEMCWEVLNDEWVGHPVWASEDSGFIAHRKNQYEETLFKIEEERHEYDFYIESNLRTIQTLETIASKIANMTEEEKSVFKLPVGLGHTSTTIYQKVIRKVYDKERGFEIIDALHEYPAVTIPVVLKRLKQKDEEWRRAQREWNKVWRELEQKVFFKSLDHLGLTFKQSDKKLLTTKQLISEISSIKVDQSNKRIHWLTPKAKSQLDYDIKDKSVFSDIMYLVNIFIEHTSNYSNPDKDRLRDFLKRLLSLMFSIPTHELEDKVGSEEVNDSKERQGTKRSLEDDLTFCDIFNRTKYQKLKNRADAADDVSSGSVSDNKEDTDGDLELKEKEIVKQEAKKPWLLGSLVDDANAQGIILQRTKYNMFANNNIYVLIRHLIVIYERLLEVKKMNEEVTKEINGRKTVKFAKDFNLISTQLKNMGLEFTGKDSYEQVLFLSKRLIEGDLEHQWFEESLRQAYRNKAFKLYTVDKVIQALVKHAHTILIDSKTAEIMMLYEADRNCVSTSSKEQILYRLQTRSHMSSTENMFRIEYDNSSDHICIQFIALDDLTLEEPKTLEDKWKYYVTSFSLSHPTEGIVQDEISIPFLEKIIETEQEYAEEDNSEDTKYSPTGVSNSNLKIRIDPVTYMLDIEEGSYDVFTRTSVNSHPVNLKSAAYLQQKDKQLKNLTSFVEGDNGWKKNLDKSTVENVTHKFNNFKVHGSLDFSEKENINDIGDDNKKSVQESGTEKALLDKTDDKVNGMKGAAEDGKGNDTTTEEVDA